MTSMAHHTPPRAAGSGKPPSAVPSGRGSAANRGFRGLADRGLADPRLADRYYRALVERDASYEGIFYVGVRTTGIFCRPTCPARKPKREHCEFFLTPKEALHASFRPCKRCRPLSHPNDMPAVVKRLVDAVEREPEKRWRDRDFREIGVDVSTARRQFKKRFGMTFVEYARARRMGLALQTIRNGGKVIDAQLDTGYESDSGFRDAFARIIGSSPSAAGGHARGQAGGRARSQTGGRARSQTDGRARSQTDGRARSQTDGRARSQAGAGAGGRPGARAGSGSEGSAGTRVLSAARLDTPLGPMLAVADEKALTMLEFVERRGLERELIKLRKKAAIIPGRTGPIDQIERELSEYFAGERTRFETPIAWIGSDFQKRVWQELLRIPPGETRSYLELAESIGRPTAFRAVAQANGANQLAIIVPCHRVINSNGELGGYGGGVPRKQWLLDHERKRARLF